ncbi:hypothetical protein M885DRAFT_569727 [Pelagophyceae sp. CCMP2097]|nr:hypothetical protein M885DRAFT_569727 [Pelagophyceae sp. CCMP2097]
MRTDVLIAVVVAVGAFVLLLLGCVYLSYRITFPTSSRGSRGARGEEETKQEAPSSVQLSTLPSTPPQKLPSTLTRSDATAFGGVDSEDVEL